jgi:hypothetical protein
VGSGKKANNARFSRRFTVLPLELRAYEVLGRVCKLTMDPRHSSIRLFRKAASELLCKHALGITGLQTSFKELHLFQDDHRPI